MARPAGERSSVTGLQPFTALARFLFTCSAWVRICLGYRTMKARENALRIRRHVVDEKNRKVEDLERMIREFDVMAADLDGRSRRKKTARASATAAISPIRRSQSQQPSAGTTCAPPTTPCANSSQPPCASATMRWSSTLALPRRTKRAMTCGQVHAGAPSAVQARRCAKPSQLLSFWEAAPRLRRLLRVCMATQRHQECG